MNFLCGHSTLLLFLYFSYTIQTVPNVEYNPLCTLQQARRVELPNLWSYLIKNLDKLGERLQKDNQMEVLFSLLHVLVCYSRENSNLAG